jgi:hypothetical protein
MPPQYAEPMQWVPEQRVFQRALMCGMTDYRAKSDALGPDLCFVRSLTQKSHVMTALNELPGDAQEWVKVARASKSDDRESHRRGPPKVWNRTKLVTSGWSAKRAASERGPDVTAK